MVKRNQYKKTKNYKKRSQKKHKKRTRKNMRGGNTKPLLDVGSGLFQHINFSDSFFPNVLGNLEKNINYLLGGKTIFHYADSNILNLGIK